MSNILLTYKDLAVKWQTTVQGLRIRVMHGELIPIKIGRLVRFSPEYISDIEEKLGTKKDK